MSAAPRPIPDIRAAILAKEPITDAEAAVLEAYGLALEADHEERLALQGQVPCATCGAVACRSCPGRREFLRVDEGSYRMTIPDAGIEILVDRLRRKSDELVGQLSVRCRLPGARTVSDDHLLSVSDFNLSSQRGRQDRARYLASRAQTKDLDWIGIVEEFAQKVISAERVGQPALLLRDVPRPKPDDVHLVDGIALLARHPMILFGDGGVAKSLLSLYFGGRLELAGVRVGIFDWELAAEDHRDRLERLFGGFNAELPGIRYVRCERPLVHEVDRLRRIVRDERLNYAILDSVAFACDGPPEAAEVAARYFQATRQLGPVGSLHVAHVSKAEGADRRPFGSAFWHNGARSTWFVRMAEPSSSDRVSIALFHRKANLGPLRAPLGFEVLFTGDRTTFRRTEVADNPDLAVGLSVRQRMAAALRRGSAAPDELAEAVGATPETVRRTARRYREQFVVLPGGNLGLKGRP